MKTIVICCSGSFYKEAIVIEKKLSKLGFEVKIPSTAKKMAQTGDYDIDKLKTWLSNPKNYPLKAKLMKEHFQEINKGDVILVLNLTKKGVPGYIGANVLMEMALAFHLGKTIFVLNKISEGAIFKEEILAMAPEWINQDLTAIMSYFQRE